MSGQIDQFEPAHLNAFRNLSFELIPLQRPEGVGRNGKALGKAPLGSKWRIKPPMPADEAQDYMGNGANVGVRLRSEHLVVDVDPRHFADGVDSLKQLQSDIGVSFDSYPVVETGGGGWHIYMLKPVGSLIVTTLQAYPGVEFKTHGTQVVAPGSVHPITRSTYRWDALSPALADVALAPERLLELIARKVEPYSVGSGRDLSAADLAELLTLLDPATFSDHGRWFSLMAACHHATRGEGRQEFVEWSIGDPAYANHEDLIGRRWDSLSCEPGRAGLISQATLFKEICDAGHAEAVKRVMSRDDFADIDEEGGEDQTAPAKSRRRGVIDEWVYVIDAEMFVRRADGKKWRKEQWRARFASLKPDGDVLNAIWRGSIPVRKFEALVYLPGEVEFPDGEDGGRYNIWRESGVSPKAGDVAAFIEHMEYMFSDETERGYVLDYLAMLVQSPGQKINYALLVKGVQGTGKSWIGRLMASIIGLPNVVFPANSEVMSNWTAWTEGAQIAIIEELMAMGRLEMANRLKPIITEPFLRIEAKNCNLYSIPNRLNLITFTNHDDAVPMENGDRRWLVVFSDAKPRDGSYYARIFAFLEGDGPAAVKDWLLKRAVVLSPKGVAPMTAGKTVMRDLSLGDAEQHLNELLAERAWPFDFELIRLDEVVAAIPDRIGRQTRGLDARVRKWLRNEVGAVRHVRYTKQGGDRRAWSLWSIDNHEDWETLGAAGRFDAYALHCSQQ